MELCLLLLLLLLSFTFEFRNPGPDESTDASNCDIASRDYTTVSILLLFLEFGSATIQRFVLASRLIEADGDTSVYSAYAH